MTSVGFQLKHKIDRVTSVVLCGVIDLLTLSLLRGSPLTSKIYKCHLALMGVKGYITCVSSTSTKSHGPGMKNSYCVCVAGNLKPAIF